MKTFFVLLAVLLTGCAYQPIVDRPGANYSKDLAECRAYEQGVAGPGTGAAVGAGAGFAMGFAICAILRGSDCGRVGAATAVLGATSTAGAGAESEAQVVRNCLRARGYAVLN